MDKPDSRPETGVAAKAVAVAAPVELIAPAAAAATSLPVTPVQVESYGDLRDPSAGVSSDEDSVSALEAIFDVNLEKLRGPMSMHAVLDDRIAKYRESGPEWSGRSVMFVHHKMVAAVPFLNKSWLSHYAAKRGLVKATENLNLKLLHDPDLDSASLDAVFNFWMGLPYDLHIDLAGHGPFDDYPYLRALSQSVKLESRKSFLAFLFKVGTYIIQAFEYANTHVKDIDPKIRALAHYSFYIALYELHAFCISIETRCETEPGFFNMLSCRFGDARSHAQDASGNHTTFFKEINCDCDHALTEIRAKLSQLGVSNPEITVVKYKKSDRFWYLITSDPVPKYQKRKLTLECVFSEGLDHAPYAPYVTEKFKSRMPSGILDAMDAAANRVKDKATAITWALYASVALFLVLFIVRVWKAYKKSRGRNLWKKLMTNEAQNKHMKDANGAMTFLYITGAIFSIATLYFDGIKHVSTVAGMFTTIAGLFTKSARGAYSFFDDVEEDEYEVDEEDDEDGQKRKKKRVVKVTHKKGSNQAQCFIRPYDDWDGAFLPDMLEGLNNQFASNRAQMWFAKHMDEKDASETPPLMPDRVPEWLRTKETDTWQILYKYPMSLLFRLWAWIVAPFGYFFGIGFLAQVMLGVVIFVVVTPALILVITWLTRKFISWRRNRHARNAAHTAVIDSVDKHKIVEDGLVFARELHSMKSLESNWLIRYARYIQAKIKIGLPLSDDELSFTKSFDVNSIVIIGRNQEMVNGRLRADATQAQRKNIKNFTNESETRSSTSRRGNSSKTYMRERRRAYENEVVEDRYQDPLADRLDEMFDEVPNTEELANRFYERLQLEKAKKTSPYAKPPGHEWETEEQEEEPERENVRRGVNRATGISAGVKIEEGLVDFKVMSNLTKLRDGLVKKGYNKFPFPNWTQVSKTPKSYMSDMNGLMAWLKARDIRLDRCDCPFCFEKKMDCKLPHSSIQIIPRPVNEKNVSETATRDHPRQLPIAIIGASVGVIRVFKEHNGDLKEGASTCLMTESGIICNQHAIDGAKTATVSFHGMAPVTIPTSAFRVVKRTRTNTPVDMVVCEEVPATLGIKRLPIRPVSQPQHLGQLTMIAADFGNDGKLKGLGYTVNNGAYAGHDIKCPPSTKDGKMYPVGYGSATYHAKDGNSGGAVFDNLDNLIGMHCSGHSMGDASHNHFETFEGLDLKKVSSPLNC